MRYSRVASALAGRGQVLPSVTFEFCGSVIWTILCLAFDGSGYSVCGAWNFVECFYACSNIVQQGNDIGVVLQWIVSQQSFCALAQRRPITSVKAAAQPGKRNEIA